jgi:hypothetical protein
MDYAAPMSRSASPSLPIGTSRDRLKVAARVPGRLPPAWIVASLRLLAETDGVDLTLVLCDERPIPRVPVLAFDRSRAARLAWSLASASDMLALLGSTLTAPDPLAPAPLEGIPMTCQIEKASRQEDLAVALRRSSPEVLVDYAPPGAPPAAIVAPPLGTWSYAFSGLGCRAPEGVGVAESAGPETLTSYGIVVRMDTEEVLAAVATAFTDSHSFTNNRGQALWSAAPLMAQEIGRFARSGRLDEDGDGAALPPSRQPTGALGSLAFTARYTARLAVDSARRALCREQWVLLSDDDSQPPVSARGPVRRLDPGPERYWADPWVVEHKHQAYVFAEELPYDTGRGRIVVLDPEDPSPRPLRTVVLEEPWHLSYPCVFRHGGDYYMLPECAASGALRLYRCRDFPARWELVRTFDLGMRAADATVVEHDGHWWMFTAAAHFPWVVAAHELHLFFTDDPVEGTWHPHPGNPICRDARRSRPGGALFRHDGRLVRVAQDGSRGYGSALRFMEVLRLTESDYRETEIAVVEPRWLEGMLGTHTLSLTTAHRVVDGRFRVPRIRIPKRPQRPPAQ